MRALPGRWLGMGVGEWQVWVMAAPERAIRALSTWTPCTGVFIGPISEA